VSRHAYLGPPGTYCEVALGRLTGDDIEPVPYRNERDAILAVAAGDVARAVVPIENALEGAVTGTLDTLALETREVTILKEVVVEVEHCLVAAPGVTLAQVAAVVSHPQALAQCRRWLGEHLPDAAQLAATSTAQAVRSVAATTDQAAIGTRHAAELYGCDVLAESVEDEPGNATRFVLLGPVGERVDGAPGRTTIVFHGGGDVAPGWLVACLSEFAQRGVNLTKIESRPRKIGLGHYLFVIDAEGEPDAVEAAIAALAGHCEEVRVLGSYPVNR
jgi:prephenate dehydratase